MRIIHLPSESYIASESKILSLKRQFLDHWAEVTGSVPDLLAAKVAGLPLFLRERYQFARTRLFGQSILLALEQGNPESAPPGEYERHADTLRSQAGEPVVLVLPALPAYIRNRMVRCGLPFIVPGSQIFLPTALIDLRERFRQPTPKAGNPLTPAAQCVLLYHLQRQPLENMPLREIAERIGYSPVLFESGVGKDIRRDLMDKCNLHTILRLPTGIFYAQGVKTNELFFTRGAQDKGNTKEVRIYDMRSNMPNFGKRTPFTREHLADFEKAIGKDPLGQAAALKKRKDTGETGHFRKFTREWIAQRDDSLDISWIKDDSTESSADLPEPAVLAASAIEEMEAIMEDRRCIIAELEEEELINA